MSSSLVVWTILTARKQEKLSFEELISKSAEVCGRETYFVQVLVDPESPNFGQLSELASLISSYEITHSATHVILQKISDYAKEAEASSPALLDSLCQTLEDQVSSIVTCVNSRLITWFRFCWLEASDLALDCGASMNHSH